MAVHVSIATPSEVGQCARVIAQALSNDAVLRALIPGDNDRPERLTSLFTSILRHGPLACGVIDTARLEPGGEIIGAAAWEGPDKRRGPANALGELTRYIRAAGARHAPAVSRQLAAYQHVQPRTPHWYLADIGVSDTARGLGVGTALLTYRLSAIDAQQLPAYLEATTTANQRLYDRLGFRPVRRIETASATPTGMLRPPHRPTPP
ncbi:GNAT family N-acetyltransferase [Streptomyces hydrogenans]|uniref:GNAT family N-acetyltransferase n=1 Tax=Streptomyces hydrogenans TaxID=1873719 RepID=UPI00343CAB65